MRLNADFDERVVVRPEDYRWVASPVPGVERMMLDRIGDEVARATSLVRYAPDSQFPSHVHGGGEEILVLAGEFRDEHGAYGPGTYLRSAIGSSHAPSVGPEGALIFVKLHQFDREDTAQIRFRPEPQDFKPGLVDGITVCALHAFGPETVALVRYEAHRQFETHQHTGGEELFVIEGEFEDEFGRYPRGTWLRNPPGSVHAPSAGASGVLLYVKTGHLGALTSGTDAPAADLSP